MQHARQRSGAPGTGEGFGKFLQRSGLVSASDLLAARAIKARSRTSLDRILISEGLVDADDMTTALSRFHGLPRIDLAAEPPDPALADRISLRLCLNHSVLPWRLSNGTLRIAASRIDDFVHVLSILDDDTAKAELVFAPASEIQAALARLHRAELTARASARVPTVESCRNWRQTSRRKLSMVLGLIGLALGLTWAFPSLIFAGLALWASFTLVVAAGLRLAAFVAHLSQPDPPLPVQTDSENIPLPRVSVLVPLIKETEIASALLTRLVRLTYPKPLLDIVLVLEENDHLTRQTIGASALPPWIRVIEVPEGQPKTKPRALNYALDFCDGDIVGIWDAEDDPDPDQVSRVVERFHNAPKDIVCLQGVLDYYNNRQNWLARCFTVEYATWFRLMLPGMSKLGFAIPLGGTTLFFRRDILEELGGWDAHNVTEDADLGFRLARHGYRTEVIATTTGEEANCRFWPWIRQRSRWLKGYMVTYLVHMRKPRTLYRQMGPWRFWGFQAHFVTALSQFILAPFLWSFWLVLLGLPHPLDPLLPREFLVAVGLLFLMVEVITILVNATAVSGKSHRHLLPWVPTLHLYYPMGAFAAYKALYELIFHPFYWDKTQHGHSLESQSTSDQSSALVGVGIELQPGYKGL